MSGEQNGKPVRYRIDMSGLVAAELNDLKVQADAVSDQTIKRALTIIVGRLQADPVNLGELIGEYKVLKLKLHAAVVPPLFVRFAINAEAKIVIIMKIGRLTKS